MTGRLGLIVSKTPLRVSFFGGGTDIPEYYLDRDGFVISATIDQHVYIAVNRCEARHVRVIYSELEQVKNFEEVKHDRVREALRLLRIETGIEICSFSDVPIKGTGLGSSSSFTVGLLHALHSLDRVSGIYRNDLASDACVVEMAMCRQPIGKQDQYAAACGGFNAIHFDADGVQVNHLPVSRTTRERLERKLMLFSIGTTRQASSILEMQVNDMKQGKNLHELDEIKKIAFQALHLLEDDAIDEFGALLAKTWEIKRSLSGGVSTEMIDGMYDRGMKAGALGGKVLGAGGGGYLLLYVPEECQDGVTKALTGHARLHFRFTSEGSRITRI